jgi:excisionase family DNA binding protein
MSSRIQKFRIEETGDGPQICGLISVKEASEVLGCSRNTTKNHARNGRIMFFWVNYRQPGEAMLFVKASVEKLRDELIKKQVKKIKTLQKDK